MGGAQATQHCWGPKEAPAFKGLLPLTGFSVPNRFYRLKFRLMKELKDGKGETTGP